MHRQSINFTDPNAAWVKSELGNGEYSSASELVNDLIRQRRKEEAEKLEVIRKLILEGIESGISDLTPQQIREQVRQGRKNRGKLQTD